MEGSMEERPLRPGPTMPPRPPARLTHVVHPGSRVSFGKLADFAPTLKAKSDEKDPKAFAFADPDGEVHVFYVGEEDRTRLLAEMTGGIVPPTAAERSKIIRAT